MGDPFSYGFCILTQRSNILLLALRVRTSVTILGSGGPGSTPREVHQADDSASVLQCERNPKVKNEPLLKFA